MTFPRENPRATDHRSGHPPTTYPIRLRRHDDGWQIAIAGVGITHAHHLDGVEAAAQRLLAATLGGDPGNYTLEG